MFDQMSYTAGLIDGEGNCAFQSQRAGYKLFTIEVKMTSESVIDWLCSNFGGLKTARPSTNPRWKHQWRWRLKGRKAEILYGQLQPFLKVK